MVAWIAVTTPNNMETLKSTLPTYINCATYELAIAVTVLLQEKTNLKMDSNVHTIPLTTIVDRAGTGQTCLQVTHETVSLWGHTRGDGMPVASIQEAIDLLFDLPITIGAYTAQPKEKGVQVGCTFVPWETVQKIAALDPKQQQEFAVEDGWRPMGMDEILREGDKFFALGRWEIVDGLAGHAVNTLANPRSARRKTCWRDMGPDEIYQEGDEYRSDIASKWEPALGVIGYTVEQHAAVNAKGRTKRPKP
jgi:hypothetical protein